MRGRTVPGGGRDECLGGATGRSAGAARGSSPYGEDAPARSCSASTLALSASQFQPESTARDLILSMAALREVVGGSCSWEPPSDRVAVLGLRCDGFGEDLYGEAGRELDAGNAALCDRARGPISGRDTEGASDPEEPCLSRREDEDAKDEDEAEDCAVTAEASSNVLPLVENPPGSVGDSECGEDIVVCGRHGADEVYPERGRPRGDVGPEG